MACLAIGETIRMMNFSFAELASSVVFIESNSFHHTRLKFKHDSHRWKQGPCSIA